MAGLLLVSIACQALHVNTHTHTAQFILAIFCLPLSYLCSLSMVVLRSGALSDCAARVILSNVTDFLFLRVDNIENTNQSNGHC